MRATGDIVGAPRMNILLGVTGGLLLLSPGGIDSNCFTFRASSANLGLLLHANDYVHEGLPRR